MRVAVNSHALPIYKKNRIASLLCIFETSKLSITKNSSIKLKLNRNISCVILKDKYIFRDYLIAFWLSLEVYQPETPLSAQEL